MRSIDRSRAFALLLSLAAAPALHAAVTWTPLGPNGGTAYRVAVAPSSPNVLYAATSGGVFKSTDRGAIWTALDRTIGRRDVRAVAVDPLDAGIVYAGTASDGIYKSTDGGATWHFSGNGLSIPNVRALAVDPRDPDVVLADAASPTAGGLFRSTDAGATWHQVSSGEPAAAQFTSFAFDLADPRTVYSAASYVFKSSDEGATWTRLDGSIFAAPANQVLVDPRRPATVLACNFNSAIRSTDAGSTWTPITLPDGVPPCAFAFGADALLHAVGATSADDGSSWTLAAPLAAGALSLAADPSSPGTFYAATSDRGVYRTMDGEASWQAASQGLRATTIFSVAVDPANDAVVYAGVSGLGLVRSRAPLGSTWRVLLASPPGFVVVDPSHPQNLYAGLFRDGMGGLLASKDGGGTWEAVDFGAAGDACQVPTSLTVDPTSSQTLYVGFETCGIGQFGLKSTDGGGTWIPLRGFDVAGNVLVAPRRPSTLYALSSTTVYKSVDTGSTWTQASGGLGGRFAGALALDPIDPRTLYVATNDALFASTDGAAHWRLVSRALPGIQQLFVDPHAPATLYATAVSFASGAEVAAGVFRSTDRGRTCTRIDPGVLGERVSVFAVDPVRAGTLFVGTNGAGLFKVTTDGRP